MRLTKEQRIEIILMAGSGSSRMVALNFNRKHGTNITHDTVAKLISKFKKTGNVADQPHYGIQVRRFLDQQFPDAWIGRRGPVEWPPRSPDLSPLDFYLWGHLKFMVYQVKIQDINHLKERITDAIRSIPSNVLMRVHQQWETRVNMCFENNGNYIEHII